MSNKPVLLLSNDDGYGAPGVLALVGALNEQYNCCIVVPDRDRSGAGQSLTLHRPIKVRRITDQEIIVEGTPADCVNLGLSGLFSCKPVKVISGINAGANLGTDVLYSGTVAAAMEGVCAGIPSIAFSLVGNRHFDSAAWWAEKIIHYSFSVSLPEGILLNVNIPDLPLSQIKGLQVTSLGRRKVSNDLLHTIDPRGQERYWIGLPGKPLEVIQGSDFYAISKGFVSITPVTLDRFAHSSFETICELFENLS